MQPSLVSCPPIGKHSIQKDDTNRLLIVGHNVIKFTPREYQILMHFLEGYVVTEYTLIQGIFGCEGDSTLRHNLDKYIDRIRLKLRPFGLSIYRVVKYGYVLLTAID